MTAQAALQRLRDEKLAHSTGRGYFASDSEAPAEPIGLDRRVKAVEAEVRLLRSRMDALESGP
jgi:tRNA (Thr-GGU) A37 N-methylase